MMQKVDKMKAIFLICAFALAFADEGDDTVDEPFDMNVEFRKLDMSRPTVTVMENVDNLYDCYEACKEAGSLCSSFSFCPYAKEGNKECMISSDVVVKGITKDFDLIPDKNCNIYNRKPFAVTIIMRKLDSMESTVTEKENVGSLHDCYKACKEAGSLCSSFSFCPYAKEDNKECMISSDVIVKGITKDFDLIPDKNCNIYYILKTEPALPDFCLLGKDTGPCRARYLEVYFNKNTGKCEEFVYGGCLGNSNRFNSKEECEEICR